jgi:hypothetical protein
MAESQASNEADQKDLVHIFISAAWCLLDRLVAKPSESQGASQRVFIPFDGKAEGRSWRLVQVSGLISMPPTASGGEARGERDPGITS